MLEVSRLPLGIPATAGLVIVAAAAAWCDVRERRIPNVLTVGGLLLALVIGGVQAGLAGLAAAAVGAALGLLVGLPVFLLGGLGGGDVKLLAAVGAFLGPGRLPLALLAIALTGGVMAAVEVVRRGAVRQTVLNLWAIIMSIGPRSFGRWRTRESGGALTVDAASAVTIPYAVAIAIGSVAGSVL